MKKLLLFSMALAAALSFSARANADVVLTYDPANGGTGNYYGQSFTANDAGFTVTGGTLADPYSLVSVELAKWSTSGYSTAQESLYLNIYQGATFLGSSTNTVNWTLNVDGIIGDDAGDAYNFTGVTALGSLSSSTQYRMYFSTTNTAGSFEFARPGVNDSNALTGGNLLNSTGGVASAGWDARFEITTAAAIPEPTSLALFGIGLVGLAARRRRG